jgi:glycosyltransferase involved in cell wall biosynthesis
MEFEARLRQPDLMRKGRPIVEYRGFVQGPDKHRLLVESDCLCFPTYYEMEGFPLVLVEALAYGLPALTSRWRGVPDVMPPGYSGLVEPRAPAAAAKIMRQLMEWSDFEGLRAHYTGGFTAAHFDKRLVEALLSIEPDDTPTSLAAL